VEKPDARTAEGYLKSGDYYWNSGMFVARASVLLAELEAHAPKVAAVVKKIRAAWKNGGDWQAAVREHFEAMPSDSIDYAVMEKSANVMVVPCDIGWSDVGSWDAVYELGAKDADGNVVKADAVMIDAKNNLLMGGKRLVAAIGVEDLCIVDTPDALLVARRDQAQQVKQVVDTLKKRGGEAHVIHRTAKRPWGSYTVLEDDGRGYKIKRIEVNPGGRLSLQSHKHRSEHWVVVSGVATVTCGDKVTDLQVNQSTYIPLGEKHRLENRGVVPVQMVEVQVGDYLGEDDIVRYDDVYGRS
jgi:mannose-1-phosphate guanylyltransferase / mannose-6-phosphate isomerase